MSSVSSTESRSGAAGWLGRPISWALLAALALGAVLYIPLLFTESHRDLGEQGDAFFFEANEAAGAPVMILALWLFYRRSHYLDVLKGRGQPIAAIGMFSIALAAFAWGAYTSAPDIQLISLLWLLAGAVLLLGGRLGLRVYWLPILFLAFALPISPVLLSAVLYPAQLITAEYAGIVLNLIGAESFVQGDQILRPDNAFIVIETCSGMRTIITLTMLTVLLIDLFERRGWHAVTLMVLAPIVAFLTNGVRVITLVLNPYSDINSIHSLQGIAMLLFGLTAMYLIDNRIEHWAGAEKPREVEGLERVSVDGVSDRVVSLRIAGICAVMVAMLGCNALVEPWSLTWRNRDSAEDVLLRAFGDWPSEKIEPNYKFMGSVRFRTWEHRRVFVDGGKVDVFLADADEQRREQTILTPRLAWPASGYALLHDQMRPIRVRDEAILSEDAQDARRIVVRRGAKTVVSYSWYERAANLPVEWFRQAFALDRSPWYRPEHILAVRLASSTGSGKNRKKAAEARIRRVYERLAPELEGFGVTPAEDAG